MRALRAVFDVRGLRAVVAGVLAATVLAACADDAAAPAPPAEIGTEADCLADGVLAALHVTAADTWEGRPAPAAGTVPQGFEPALVVECRLDLRVRTVEPLPRQPVPDLSGLVDEGGRVDVERLHELEAPDPPPPPASVAVQRVERAGDLGRLLAVLAEPSDEPGPDQICPAVLQLRPVLFLVDARGRAVLVTWPTDECGNLRPGALDALESVPVVDRVSLTRERG